MYQQPDRPPDLHREIADWLAHYPQWYLRPAEPAEDDEFYYLWMPSYRIATASEIAEEIVNDPALRAVLGFLISPPGAAIEQSVARTWLTPWQAQLLTDGLTQAWKIVLDQNRPVWQRADVLVGTVLLLTIVGLAIMAGRKAT